MSTQDLTIPITDLEQWVRKVGAAQLARDYALTIRLDEDATPVSFSVTNGGPTAVRLILARAEYGGDVERTTQRTTTARALINADILAPLMASMVGEAIVADLRVKAAPADTSDPDDLCLVEMSECERYALPARFHRPIWNDLGKPAMWLCAVCWGDCVHSQWPCTVAARHGRDVAKAAGLGYTK